MTLSLYGRSLGHMAEGNRRLGESSQMKEVIV